MGPRFIHDFADVRLPPLALVDEPVDLPALLARLVAPAFDQTVDLDAEPWPVESGPVLRRDDGWVYPVQWPAGRGGLVPAVEADLGLYPTTEAGSHLELLGTYTPWPGPPVPSRFARSAHLRTVQGVRRLVLALAEGLATDPIAVGPVRSGRPGPGDAASADAPSTAPGVDDPSSSTGSGGNL